MTNVKQYYIATAADEKYYVPMYVMLFSLFENNKNINLHVAILYKSLSNNHKNDIESLAAHYNNSIKWLCINRDETTAFYVSEYITEASLS